MTELPLLLGFKWARAALVIASLLSLIVLAGLVAGNPIMIGLGIAGIIVALIVALASGLSSWRAQPLLRRMVEGDHYVHWRYEGKEWERHLAAARKRGIRLTTLMLLFIGLIGIAVLAVIWIETRYRASTGMAPRDLAYWLRWLVPLSLPAGVLLAVGIAGDAVEKWQQERLRGEGGRAYIGREGIYWCGEFWPSGRSVLQYCDQAVLKEGDPPHLVFSFRTLLVRNAASVSTHHAVRVLHVPIPAGCEAEARAAISQVQRDWFAAPGRA